MTREPNFFKEQAVTSWIRSETLGAAVAGALCVLTLAACGGQTADQSAANAQTVSSPPARVVARGTTAPSTAATPLVSPGSLRSNGSATPSASANASISPREVTTGSVTLDLSIQPARHMFDGAATTNSLAQPQSTPPSAGATGSQTPSSAVFAGGMVGTANNIDPSQAPPADSAQSIVRHVVVHVRTRSGGQPIPYLNVSLDLLLDGHPVLYDQPLEPMTPAGKDSLQYYYGNNVKFPQRGTYQMFVRIQPNPMLGQNPPQAAQFDVVLR